MFVTWKSHHYCNLKITLALSTSGLRNGARAEKEVITAGLLACMMPSLNIHIGNWGWGEMFLGKCQAYRLLSSPENYLVMQTEAQIGEEATESSIRSGQNIHNWKNTNAQAKVVMHPFLPCYQKIYLMKPSLFSLNTT